jgi:hypothetical protein
MYNKDKYNNKNKSKSKNKNGYKGNRDRERTSSRDESVDKKNDKDFNSNFNKIESNGAPNDPDDYFTDLKLAEQATSVSVPQFLGHSPYTGNFNLPTVEVIALNPSLGVSSKKVTDGTVSLESGQCGAWMASQKLYTLLSINSGRTANYQQNDVLAATLSLSEVTSMIEYARRFFGVATTYSLRNRAYAVRLLSMLAGGTADQSNIDNNIFGEDFIANMANYRMRLNILITKINQLPIIANMGWLRKSIRLYQKIYVDDASSMAQTYAFMPYSTWRINETNATGTKLETVQVQRVRKRGSYIGIQTFKDLLDIISGMIDPLLNSTTLNYVYADMLQYAAKNSMTFFTLDYVTEGYAVVPVLEPRMNEIVHNAMYTGAPQPEVLTGFTHTPDNDVVFPGSSGSIEYRPLFSVSFATAALDPAQKYEAQNVLIDFQSSEPDLTSRVDAYKLKFIPSIYFSDDQSSAAASAEALPDHYAVDWIIYGVDANMFRMSAPYPSQNKSIAEYSSGFIRFRTQPTDTAIRNTSNPDLLTSQSFFGTAGTYTAATSNSRNDGQWVSYTGADVSFLTYMDNEKFKLMNDMEYQGLLDFRMK